MISSIRDNDRSECGDMRKSKELRLDEDYISDHESMNQEGKVHYEGDIEVHDYVIDEKVEENEKRQEIMEIRVNRKEREDPIHHSTDADRKKKIQKRITLEPPADEALPQLEHGQSPL